MHETVSKVSVVRKSSKRTRMRVCGLYIPTALLLIVAFMAMSATSAQAASPWWSLDTTSAPSVLPPGGETEISVIGLNLGDAPTTAPATVSLQLPPGVEVVESEGVPQVSLFIFREGFPRPDFGPAGPLSFFELCRSGAHRAVCSTASQSNNPELEGAELLGPLNPYEYLSMQVKVKNVGSELEPGYEARVSGGGAPRSLTRRRSLSAAPAAAFGTEDYSLLPEAEGGATDARAGSHPFQLTATFNLDQTADPLRPPALARNLSFQLPPGQLGNATVLPKCTAVQFSHIHDDSSNDCPAGSVLGVASVTVDEPLTVEEATLPVPLFNLVPKRGEPARFGFVVYKAPVILDTSLRSGEPGQKGSDYGVTVSASNITQISNFISSVVTFWGAPDDERHQSSRGWACLAGGFWRHSEECGSTPQPKPPAFLTVPTNCSAPFATTAEGESWPNQAFPAGAVLDPFTYQLGDLLGCNQVPFSPEIEAEPTTDLASAPTGLDVNIDFHDEGLTNPEGLAQSQLKDTTVTLPEGLTINPSAGVGLGGCTRADYARESVESAPGAGCPNNSKLGTVEIETPLLTQKIHGSLFIAQPQENPFGSLVALYIVAKNPETGVLVKLAGKVTPDPVRGRLTTTFENNPELPFDHFNFHFREGQQAPLISPPACGTYTTQAQLTPWSNPTQALTETSPFTISKGFDGGACPSGGVPPFHPAIQSGTLNNNAGVFSPFYLHLTRTDGEQEITGFSTNLPPGLTGILSGIPFCGEAEIAAARTKTGGEEEASPSCPSSSLLGHSQVGTGVGAVLAYTPGKIYLAGPYGGDPFSLVSVTSAVVGPFDLGTVVVRFGLRIDPNTAQVSVDPSASEPIPHIIQGIVTHVRDIRVYIDRPNFTLNPTSCAPMSIASTLQSSLGQSATVSSPFQAASCASLKFAPKFSVSTSGNTSKALGASLTATVSEPAGAFGTQANISLVKVELPKQLPSRLTTLQKACTNAQFVLNPANCPAASKIGYAKVITPLLPVPLEGPAIFVSHGGEAFPSLTMVLQGYGVTVDLVGTTFISKSGITSTTFKTVPDTPFNSFSLTLPEGKFSALAANGSLCGQTLKMPNEFKGQNGLEVHQSTTIEVTGCKPAIRVLRHHVNGRTATIVVSVPSAGKLVATGNGLSKGTGKIGKAGNVTVKLTLSKGEQAFLNKHKGRKLRATIHLTFTPTRGSKLKTSTTVFIG